MSRFELWLRQPRPGSVGLWDVLSGPARRVFWLPEFRPRQVRPPLARACRRFPLGVLALSLLLTVVAVSELRANGPAIGRNGAAIFPVGSTTIQLRAESVLVRLPDPSRLSLNGRAECIYFLRNLSDSTQSFPMSFLADYPFAGMSNSYQEAVQFRVRANGEDLPVRFRSVDRQRWLPYEEGLPDSLPTWELRIGPAAEIRLVMTFLVTWTGDETVYFSYDTRPAQLWAGRVESAHIEFQIDSPASNVKCSVWKRTPHGGVNDTTACRWARKGPAWDFTEWEPEEVLHVTMPR
jgi:hypothetical protein